MLVLGLVLAALLRVAWQARLHADASSHQPHGNTIGFLETASLLLDGDLLAGDGVLFYGPLYPAFLAACFSLGGEHLLVPRAVQAALGLLLGVLAFQVTRRLFDEHSALWAAGLVLFSGPALFFEGLLVATTLSTVLLGLGALLLVASRPARVVSGARWSGGVARALLVPFGSGAALGLAAWGRGNVLLLLPPAVAGLLWIAWRETGTQAGAAAGDAEAAPSPPRSRLAARLAVPLAFVLGASAVLLPVTVRNRVRGGEWILLVSQGGLNFFVGNNPEATGTYELPESAGITTDLEGAYAAQSRAVAERDAGRELTWSEVSSYWTRRALRWMADEPAAAAALQWRKLRLFLDPYEVPIHRNAQHYLERSWWARWLPGWGVLLPLGLAGLILVRPWTPRRALVLALALTYSASVVLFFVVDRYRFPVVALLVPFAGLAGARLAEGVAALVHGRGRAPGPRILAAGIVLAASAIAVHAAPSVVTPEWRARYRALELHRHGLAWERAGDVEAALAEYERALEHAPGHVSSRLGQARSLLALGRDAEALAILERLAPLAPERTEVGRLLDEARRRTDRGGD